MRFTDQQEAVFAEGVAEHMKIIAYAGSGKTTTLVELQKRTRKRTLYCPFNKTIADEARLKFAGTGCQVSTLHAFAWNAIRSPGRSPHKGGASDIRARGVLGRVRLPKVKGWGDFRVAAAANRALARFCVSDAPEITEEHAREALIESVGDPASLRAELARQRAEDVLAHLVRPVHLIASLYRDSLLEDEAYTHDLYLKTLELEPALLRRAFAGFQAVYKDEAQDTNPVETSILRKSRLPIISVGDPYQQIYSWRGAQSALDKLPGKRLHLTESFRFGQDLADLAMAVLTARPVDPPTLPLIGAGDGKGRGKPANAILCRTNAGVLEQAMRVASKGKSYFVDNAESLVADLRAAEALHSGKPSTGGGPFSPFAHWSEAVAEAEAGDRGMERIVKIVEEGRADEVVGLIKRSNPDEARAEITIMTAHRSKGREFPFVMLGDDWRGLDDMRKRWEKAKRSSPRDEVLALEEYNALYVAATRAQMRVYGIDPLLRTEEAPRPR